MPERSDTFTLYLRGGDGAKLRDVLKPFGNGGDMERFSLDGWDAEVILGRGAEVALIRVAQTTDLGSLRTLIIELHEAAREAGLVLSDDVHSKKTAAELISAFGLEGTRADAQRAGKPSARWGMNKTIVYWVLGAAMVVVALYALDFLRDAAHHMLEGQP
jgi:hypothetical protein